MMIESSLIVLGFYLQDKGGLCRSTHVININRFDSDGEVVDGDPPSSMGQAKVWLHGSEQAPYEGERLDEQLKANEEVVTGNGYSTQSNTVVIPAARASTPTPAILRMIASISFESGF